MIRDIIFSWEKKKDGIRVSERKIEKRKKPKYLKLFRKLYRNLRDPSCCT